MPQRLINQLAALRVKLSLERDRTRRLILSVQLAETELLMAHMIANHPKAEPLPQLLARLVTGQVDADTAGQAIARDLSLATAVERAVEAPQIALSGQAGDVRVGDVAGRDVIHIHIGARGAA